MFACRILKKWHYKYFIDNIILDCSETVIPIYRNKKKFQIYNPKNGK